MTAVDESAAATVTPEGSTTVTVCPDGPLLVRGAFTLRTADGTLVDSSRSVLALCRCGRSRLKPLCDGSHKAARFRDDASAADLRHVLETATPPPRTGTV